MDTAYNGKKLQERESPVTVQLASWMFKGLIVAARVYERRTLTDR